MLLVPPQEGSSHYPLSIDFNNLKDYKESCDLAFNAIVRLSKEGKFIDIFDKDYVFEDLTTYLKNLSYLG